MWYGTVKEPYRLREVALLPRLALPVTVATVRIPNKPNKTKYRLLVVALRKREKKDSSLKRPTNISLSCPWQQAKIRIAVAAEIRSVAVWI